MKKLGLIIFCGLFLNTLFAGDWHNQDYEILTYKWASPSGANTLLLLPHYKLEARNSSIGVKEISVDDPTTNYHEIHGIPWLDQASYNWINDDLIIFNDGLGVAIIDVREGRFLVDNVFESMIPYGNDPTTWFFVRDRGAWFHGGWNYKTFKDTIGIASVNPDILHPEAPSESAMDHLKHIEINGVVLAPPVMLPNGKYVGLLQWIDGNVILSVFNFDLKELVHKKVDVDISELNLSNTGIKSNLSPILNALLSSGINGI